MFSQNTNSVFRNVKRLLNKNRRLCSQKTTDCTSKNEPRKPISKLPPLTQPLPGFSEPKYVTVRPQNPSDTQVTTLSNGIRVASVKQFGEFCTIGAAIDAGSRYESAYPNGLSHFLEKLAFHSTEKYRDRDHIINMLEKHGGLCDCQFSRDTFIYAASAYSSGLDEVLKMIADVMLRPQITDNEIDFARKSIEFELDSLKMKPEQDLLITDMIHAAAFRENTLGLPKLCPLENFPKIDRKVLMSYLSQYYRPERIVVAGVGVEHERLLESVQRYFIDQKPIWSSMSDLFQPPIESSIPQYTGGLIKDPTDIPPFASADLPILAHVMIGLESFSHRDDLFVPLCVLNTMMGGGGSFSAGGPGKGMYSRLYTNVLNQCHWMYSAAASNHSYNDTGLFVIHASSPPRFLNQTINSIVRELFRMSESITDTELNRSKTQLKSMLLMNLESRAVIFEDVSRQVLANGNRKSPEEFIQTIDNVTKDDIIKVAKKMLSSVPAVAVRGDLSHLYEFKSIQTQFFDYHSGRNKTNSNIFSNYRQKESGSESLQKQLVAKIKATGPLTVAQYMREALIHPTVGYYAQNRDILSAKTGDFITSPELCQIFGEIFKHFDQLKDVSVHLVEVSDRLSCLQAKKLCPRFNEVRDTNSKFFMHGLTSDDVSVHWYRRVEDIPDDFSLIIAHEFFDALPIHKFQNTKNGWREVLIDFDDEKNQFRYVIARNETPASKLYVNSAAKTKKELEMSPDQILILEHLANRLSCNGGAALIIDYGYDQHDDKGDTFRAYRNHKQVDPLKDPGSSDLTADVNFAQLKSVAESKNNVSVFGPIKQKNFLTNIGFLQRLKILENNLLNAQNSDQKLKYLNYCRETLLNDQQMGSNFKVLALYPATLKKVYPEFEPLGFA